MAILTVPLWINGAERPSSSGGTFDVKNPQTNQVVSIAASASSQDCLDAVAAAAAALPAWEQLPPLSKRTIFLTAADLMDSEAKRAAQTTHDETGAVAHWATFDAQLASRTLREAAALATQIKGETFPSGSTPGAECIVKRAPHGVILAIAPWNAPVGLTARAIATPLICGNTAVLKCSEVSPGSQSIIAEILHKAGLTPGVLNFISISREDSPKLTAELIAHPSVRHINFTGSDRVGRIIAGEAAKYLKPCVFELGGKAPAVILADADIGAAARAVASGAMLHSGQICMSTERAIVQRPAAAPFTAALTAAVQALRAGAEAPLGCLFSSASAANVVGMLREAQTGGAEVLVGDMQHAGAIVQPHVLRGVKPGMRAWDRESFGPVVVVAEVDTVDEAISLANASDYSLTASVWTRDVYAGLQVAGRIRSGCTSINGATVHSEIALGLAGLGGATGYGRFDVDNFTVKRLVVIHPPNQKYPLVG